MEKRIDFRCSTENDDTLLVDNTGRNSGEQGLRFVSTDIIGSTFIRLSNEDLAKLHNFIGGHLDLKNKVAIVGEKDELKHKLEVESARARHFKGLSERAEKKIIELTSENVDLVVMTNDALKNLEISRNVVSNVKEDNRRLRELRSEADRVTTQAETIKTLLSNNTGLEATNCSLDKSNRGLFSENLEIIQRNSDLRAQVDALIKQDRGSAERIIIKQDAIDTLYLINKAQTKKIAEMTQDSADMHNNTISLRGENIDLQKFIDGAERSRAQDQQTIENLSTELSEAHGHGVKTPIDKRVDLVCGMVEDFCNKVIKLENKMRKSECLNIKQLCSDETH